jgi:hypothetical protein
VALACVSGSSVARALPVGRDGRVLHVIVYQDPLQYDPLLAVALACIRSKESGDDYATDTGNGYSGAYQFVPETWRSISGLPGQAADYGIATQDAAAAKLAATSGWGQWPVSSLLCGLR